MIIADTIYQTRLIISQARRAGKTIGCVPTMGALHEGHLALIHRCVSECDFSVVTIFVNPTQFGPNEDFESYPRTFETDCEACRAAGVDLIFAPAVSEMYPSQNLTWINVDKLGEHLCGASRPGFFRGVCTVVAKLFHIVNPDIAYFGQKDAQQLAIIKRMVTDLNFPVDIRACNTVRASDGLALSSRNDYLNAEQRRQALSLSQALNHAAELIRNGKTDPQVIIAAMQDIIKQQPLAQIDYISIVDSELLQPLISIDRPCLIALAVKVGPARLIDNILVDPPGRST